MTVHRFGPLSTSGEPIVVATPYGIAVSLGEILGTSGVIIHGHNPSQTAASGFVDVAESGDLTYLTGAETMKIVSTSTDDDGDPVGTGLRTLRVDGVNGSGAAISETITMDGTTDVTTSNSYLRVNFLTGLTVGSVGWNVGSITATATVAGTIQCEMDETEGLSQASHYTVPLGHTFHLTRVDLNTAKIVGGSNPEVEFKLYVRSGGDGFVWVQLFDKLMDTSVTDELDVDWPFPPENPPLIERSDIRMRADTDQNSTECRVRIYGYLVAN